MITMAEETILNKILLEIINIKDKQDDMQKQMNEGFARLDAKIENVRQELHEEIQAVRQELHEEIQAVRQELHEEIQREIQGVKQELHEEIQGVKKELHGEIQGVKQQLEMKIDNLSKELQEVKELAQYNKENGDIIKQVCQKKFAEYDRHFIELDDICRRKRVH